MSNDLEIPDFLSRKKNPHLNQQAPARKERAPAAKKPSPKEERAEDIKLVADRRWRNWKPGDLVEGFTTLRRPRKTTFRKLVRAEFAEYDRRTKP